MVTTGALPAASPEAGGAILFIVLLIISVWIYFIPSQVAKARKHDQLLAIFVTNLLLGWMFVGWAAALIWACVGGNKKGS